MIKTMDTQHTGNQDLELLQANMKNFAKSLEDNPLLDGVLIEDVEFTGAVTVVINHKLGRKARGWFPTDFEALAGTGVIRDADWDDKTLTLTSSAACDLDLWIF